MALSYQGAKQADALNSEDLDAEEFIQLMYAEERFDRIGRIVTQVVSSILLIGGLCLAGYRFYTWVSQP